MKNITKMGKGAVKDYYCNVIYQLKVNCDKSKI